MGQLTRLLGGDRRDPAEVFGEAFGASAPVTPGALPENAVAWARGVLASAGLDPAKNPVASIAALRRDRDLGLSPTKWLVEYLASRRP